MVVRDIVSGVVRGVVRDVSRPGVLTKIQGWMNPGAEYPDGAILHFDANLGFVDQTGNQQAVLIGSAYPSVAAGFALNESGKEWGFDLILLLIDPPLERTLEKLPKH